MRIAAAAVLVVAMLVGQGLAVVNVTLVADQPVLEVGQQTQVHILAQGTQGAIYGMAGNILASGEGLEATPGSFTFDPDMLSSFPIAYGTPGPNGGWNGFGTKQTSSSLDRTFALQVWEEVASYTVTAVSLGDTVLTYDWETGEMYNGWTTVEVGFLRTTQLGTVTPATITVVPEPSMFALLALGTAALRRRLHR